MKTDAKDKLNSALAKAHQVSDLPPIAQDRAKKQEILGVVQNLEAAIRALDGRTDDEGRPITPAMIGTGLARMLETMNQHAIWFRLHKNVTEDIQRQLYALEDEIKAAVASLGVKIETPDTRSQDTAIGRQDVQEDDIRKRIFEPKKWWQFWKSKRKADLLLVLVEKELPNAKIGYLAYALTELGISDEYTRPKFDIKNLGGDKTEELQVTDRFEDESFIGKAAKAKAELHGFGDSYKLRWRPYSSPEGVRGTIILIYRE